MSARADHIRAKLRGATLVALLPAFTGTTPDTIAPEPPQLTYSDALTEALDVLARLGAEPPPPGIDAEVNGLVRQAYALGWRACENRLTSAEVADAIAVALEDPEKVCESPGYGLNDLPWKVRAVQRAAVYGVPKTVEVKA